MAAVNPLRRPRAGPWLGRDFAQRAFERLWRLSARDQPFAVDDGGWYGMDARLLVALFLGTDLIGVRVRFQHLARLRRIEADVGRDAYQHLAVGDIFLVGEIRAEQCALQRECAFGVLERGPMQQAVRIEGVPDAAAMPGIDHDAERRGTLADRLAIGLQLRFADAVLVHQVSIGVLALAWKLWIELERLQVDVGFDASIQLRERRLKTGKADCAPRAGDVGNEVDAQAGG